MNRIKKFRKLAGISQDDLAIELSVSRNTISSWERGQYEPTFRNALRICATLLPESELEEALNSIFPEEMWKEWYWRI